MYAGRSCCTDIVIVWDLFFVPGNMREKIMAVGSSLTAFIINRQIGEELNPKPDRALICVEISGGAIKYELDNNKMEELFR